MTVTVITTISFAFLFLIVTNAKETLYLGVYFTNSLNTGFIPAMDLALETIKNDTTLLFNFNITRSDAMVSSILTAGVADPFTPLAF